MKKIFVVALGIIMCTLSVNIVKAETISYKRLDNIYFNLNVDGVSSSNHVTMFYLDNRLAYCIEPGAAINTKTYNSTSDWSKTGLSEETQKYLEKIGYYGYEYPNHQTPNYYIATQELIWKAIKNVDVYWTTGANGTGSVIDLSKEKNEILFLVKKHDTIPSFTNDTITGEKGTTKTFYDENMVLNDLEISKSSYHKIDKQNNKLVIDFSNDLKEETLTLTKQNYYKDLLLVYTMPGSQALASLRISNPESYSFRVKSIEIPEEPEQPKNEIVKVPSTGDDYKTSHFNIVKFYNYDFRRYN